MPSLIPEQLAGPGTHVFVIGVSEYRHFEDGVEPTNNGNLLEMSQLTAAARSASEFAAFMLNEYRNPAAPVSSLRVLLSPSPGEEIHPDVQDLLNGDFAATREAVESELIEFRNVCGTNTDNVVVVYVAGHGVQLTGTGSIVLLHDCGSTNHITLLKGAIDMASVHAGFDHPDMAQTQFWFVDACRQEPDVASRFDSMDSGLILDEPDGEAESTPMFLAATTGTQAYARIGGVTLFNEALLWGLRGGIAAEPEHGAINNWHITALELAKKLRPRVKALAEAENAEQTVGSTGTFTPALFHVYDLPPPVDIHLDILPVEAVAGSQGSLRHDQKGFVVQDFTNWPLEERVDAGIYEISIDTPPGFDKYERFLRFYPPVERREINVTS